MAGYNITKRSLCVKTAYLLHGANQAHGVPVVAAGAAIRSQRATVEVYAVSLARYRRVVLTSSTTRADGNLRSFRCFLSLVNYGTFGCKVPSERSVDDVPLGGVMLPL